MAGSPELAFGIGSGQAYPSAAAARGARLVGISAAAGASRASAQRVKPRIAVAAAQPAVSFGDLPVVLDRPLVVATEQAVAHRRDELAQPADRFLPADPREIPVVPGTRCATHSNGIPTEGTGST